MPSNCVQTDSMSESARLHQPAQLAAFITAQETQQARLTPKNPVVIGLYGIPGSGKSFLLNELNRELDRDAFQFYEGSEMISDIVPGGLAAFEKLDEPEKFAWREQAIQRIRSECLSSGRAAVVTGHFMFWAENAHVGLPVYTPSDLEVFTHILYLDIPAETISQRLSDDTQKQRFLISIDHIRSWQQAEKTGLRQLCRQHSILFSLLSPRPDMVRRISTLIQDFQTYSTESNMSKVEARLDDMVSKGESVETVLVLDGDKTLATADTGVLFWEMASRWNDEEHPLSALFSSSLGYSEMAFRQATLLYEEADNEDQFDGLCESVAARVKIHLDFVSLLQKISAYNHIGVVVITCGLCRVWEKILDREGLSESVKVIGGGRIADGPIVTATVKSDAVARLKNFHKVHVWAFGDSPLDLPMLEAADEAIVVVGDEISRSKSMDTALSDAIDTRSLRARQCLLPGYVAPRLDNARLPEVKLTDPDFVNTIISRRRGRPSPTPGCDPSPSGLQVLQATEKNAAKLLMTPTRDARVSGPALRAAHGRVGWYLATEFLSEMIGVEESPIPHVQGHQTNGYRLYDEEKTSIIALMRGGEPMALGVNEAFPLAMFIHATRPGDIKLDHIQQQRVVILVDSVVNSGKTVTEFVQHIRNLCVGARIVVLAGVVQAKAISEGKYALEALARHGNVNLVALRLSENEFTGTRGTDTGNRLFNTTHLP
ncbi:hypothetical protein G7Z17_g5009 [Cylindrodendrum hubeiense]|uniref:Phosphoribosyltransferase domain-containing protein n=1 Tax=Cylindrodendrum hubeiense TaxID=595255 RepID=A0A9P5H7U3_9HYPO|nr:hypothetical protein G7Z17_g5009 [Cylindrodendrum hubeiense]